MKFKPQDLELQKIEITHDKRMLVWRAVVGYEGLYEVSDYGDVRSVFRMVRSKSGNISELNGKRVLASVHPTTDARIVRLNKKGEYKWIDVRYLVANAFLDIPLECQKIGHEDGNAANNHYKNLKCVSTK